MAQNVAQYGSSKIPGVPEPSFPNAFSEFDKARLRSYKLYEDLYFTNTEDYKVILRGQDAEGNEQNRPVYIPNAQKIVEAKLGYLCKGFKLTPNKTNTQVDDYVSKLMKRENWDLKLRSQNRWKLVRGDAHWYITADENRPEGKRISIHELDPSTFYPIEDDEDRLIGCYIVDEVPLPNGKKGEVCARVQKYWRPTDSDGNLVPDADIKYKAELYETGKWDERNLDAKDLKVISTEEPEKDLPGIKSLPVYRDRNNPPQNGVFGRSELAGLEALIIDINQMMTDEELTLIMHGLGVFATSAGAPRDSAGNIVPWQISPLTVIEHGANDKFYRVEGVGSIQPMQDHMKYADEQIQQTVGLSDMALGVVDSATAESGIALQLKLGPTIVSNVEKQDMTRSILNQMFYDLIRFWLPAFESIADPGEDYEVEVTFEDPMPVNREKKFEQLMALWDASLIPAKKICEQLTKILGFELTEQDFKAAIEDKKSMAIATDPLYASMGQDAANAGIQDPNAVAANPGGATGGNTGA